MALDIIGAGFGRTGTASLRAALELLGFTPCYHMFEIRDDPSRARAWLETLEGEPPALAPLFQGYRATVDWPGAAVYERLMVENPQAKVILTTRPSEAWYASARDTIYALYDSFPSWITWPGSPVRDVVRLLDKVIWSGTFKGRFEDSIFAKETFERHNNKVKLAVPRERLLVYEVSQGWEPLCDFLKVPIPKVPFPHINERKNIQSIAKRVKAAMLFTHIVIFPLGMMELCLRWRRSPGS